MHRLLEQIGIDWLPLLWGKQPFPEENRPDSQSFQQIDRRFAHLDDEKVDDALEYCQALLERVEKRSTTIETKAFALLGISGTATAFATAFAGLLLDRGKIEASPLLLIPAVLYVLTVASFLWAIYLALKVVAIGDYHFAYPSADDALTLSAAPLRCIRRNRVVSILYSFYENQRVVNRKGTYLSGAQTWFRNSICLLFVMALSLAVYVPLRPSTAASLAPSLANPTSTLAAIPTAWPTQTLAITATYTPVPTDTPSPTDTASPRALHTATP